jgi:hypothetical protein
MIVNELSPELEAIGIQLRRAYAGRLRRRRLARVTTAGAALVAVFAATAAAAATGDLQLDPAKWSVLGGGSVDGGQAAYVHAKNLQDGSHSTFMVEHDAGIERYQAFLLHERVKAAADETSPVPVRTEPGPLCTREQLTRAEQTALDSLRAGESPESALDAEFAGEACRGLDYAAEIAGLVFSGTERRADLMPGAE